MLHRPQQQQRHRRGPAAAALALAAVLGALGAAAAGPPRAPGGDEGPGRVSVRGGAFVLPDGRAGTFHGWCALVGLELFPPLAGVPESPAFAAGALEDLKGLGLNTARVGFLWSRYETAPGQWNETYLGQVEGMLDQLRDHGMYAILDMHQDQMR